MLFWLAMEQVSPALWPLLEDLLQWDNILLTTVIFQKSYSVIFGQLSIVLSSLTLLLFFTKKSFPLRGISVKHKCA